MPGNGAQLSRGAESRGDKGLLLSGNKDSVKQHEKVRENVCAASCLELIVPFCALKTAKRGLSKWLSREMYLLPTLRTQVQPLRNHTVKRRKQDSGNLSSDLHSWDP